MTRSDVTTALVSAHRSMVIATVAVAISVVVAGYGSRAMGGGPGDRRPAAALLPPIVVLSTEQPEHVRARLRGITNRIKAVAVVVMVPVAVGAVGTFSRLLNTF